METAIALIVTITASLIAVSTEARKWYTTVRKEKRRQQKK